MINAVIIDDEKLSRNFIESILKENFSDITIKAKAATVIDGVKAIANNKPDIVFLDIQMNEGTGFDVLDSLQEKNFEVIFVTAYDQYAIKAFKYNAIDYITKPIDLKEFKDAVVKVLIKKHYNLNYDERYNALKESLSSRTFDKITIPNRKGFEYVKISEIVRLQAEGRYTKIFLTNNKDILASKNLSDFSNLVNENNFYKPHKSHVINLDFVKMLVKQGGNQIILEDDSEIPLSRNKVKEFTDIINKNTSAL